MTVGRGNFQPSHGIQTVSITDGEGMAKTNLNNNGVRNYGIIIFFMPERPRGIDDNLTSVLRKLRRGWR